MTSTNFTRLEYKTTVHSLRTGEPVNVRRQAGDTPLEGVLVDGEHLLVGIREHPNRDLSPLYTAGMLTRRLLLDEFDFEKDINHVLYKSTVVADLHATGPIIEVGIGLQRRGLTFPGPWEIELDGAPVSYTDELVGHPEHTVSIFYRSDPDGPRRLGLTILVRVNSLPAQSWDASLPDSGGFDAARILREVFFKPQRNSSLQTSWQRVLIATQHAHARRTALVVRAKVTRQPEPVLQSLPEDVCQLFEDEYGIDVSAALVNTRWRSILRVLRAALNGEDRTVDEEDIDTYVHSLTWRPLPASRPTSADVHQAIKTAHPEVYRWMSSPEAQQKAMTQNLITALCETLTRVNAVPTGHWPTLKDIATAASYHHWSSTP